MAPQTANTGTKDAETSPTLALGARTEVTTPPPVKLASPLHQTPPRPDKQHDRPVTPPAQILREARTPMAPGRTINKRKFRQDDSDDEFERLGRHSSPTAQSRVSESVGELGQILATVASDAAAPATVERRPHSGLKDQGLVVVCLCSKEDAHKAQALVNSVERDSSHMSKLMDLIKRGRQSGASPGCSFHRGGTRIRYVYISAKDVDYEPVEQNPHKKQCGPRTPRQ